MKKLMSALLLVLMLNFFVNITASDFVIQAQTKVTTENNHVLLNVGEALDTSTVSVTHTFGTITMNQGTLASSDPAVQISGNSVSISSKGVFPITLTYQSTTMTVYFITKLASETEYTLYEEDFNYPNGALPSSLTLLNNVGQQGGSAAINNQRLMLSPSTIVLFPSYLAGFSNYIIEADMRMTVAANSARWTSVLFRYTTENYYQMAVRQDASASNGVEFAKRVQGAWNVPMTASYSEAIDPAKTYRLKLDVLETRIIESINDTVVLTYDGMFEYDKGRIGVQADNVTVYYDNIKITLPETYIAEERYEFTQIVDVYQPTTGIIAPASSIVWLNHASEIDGLKSSIRPATAILRVNHDLDVLNQAGEVIMSLNDLLIDIDGMVIPAIYTNDTETAVLVAEYLRSSRIIDVFFISDSSEAILAAREVHGVIRGVKHYPMTDVLELTTEDLLDIRRETNRAQAVASIIPIHLLDRDKVFYMQQRLMTVWTTAQDDTPSLLKALLSGANGIVAQNYQGLFDVMATFPANTHLRRPLMIAHRGLYNGGASSPENTIESSLVAIEKGTDILEIDIHLTVDMQVIVLHDNNTARTAPDFDSITVAGAFLHQLKAIYLRDPQSDRTDIKIPTLTEYLTAIKGTGIVVFVELKPTNDMLVDLTAQIVEELDMYDQVVIITFQAQNIRRFNEVYPEMANGWLNSSVLNAQSVETSLSNMISSIVPINATLNPNFGPLTQDFIKAIVHRGLTVWPWTLNELAMLNTYFNYGAHGLTTDFIGYYENTFNRLEIESYRYNYIIGESQAFKVNARIETPNGLTYPLMPTYTLFDPNNTGMTLDAQGNLTSVLLPGTVYGYTTFTSALPDGRPIVITSDLIEFVFELPAPEPEEPTEEVPLGLIIPIIIGSTALLGGLGFLGFRWYKLKKLVK
jgi:glycerophosphoryl diester phosphodiesterase